jgi:hypothetical protein
VAARSAAEIPVVILPFAPMDTWNAVPCAEVFCDVIGTIWSSSSRSPSIGMQMSPRP